MCECSCRQLASFDLFFQFVFGNGSGGESIFSGRKFKDERAGLGLKHDRRGILAMGNSGKNSNSSQWFITLDAAPQCDNKHVVFGEVVSGWAVLQAVENLGTTVAPHAHCGDRLRCMGTFPNAWQWVLVRSTRRRNLFGCVICFYGATQSSDTRSQCECLGKVLQSDW